MHARGVRIHLMDGRIGVEQIDVTRDGLTQAMLIAAGGAAGLAVASHVPTDLNAFASHFSALMR